MSKKRVFKEKPFIIKWYSNHPKGLNHNYTNRFDTLKQAQERIKHLIGCGVLDIEWIKKGI